MSPTKILERGDGIQIAYETIGQGPDLMLLHGAGKTKKDWHKFGYIIRLKEDFRVINVDIRGSGESTCLDKIDDYAIENIYQDLEAVADVCGVEQMCVWGYSFGGAIARYLGAWSNRVSAIAIIGVTFGAAVQPEFDRYIDQFIAKYGAASSAKKDKPKSAIKGRMSVWVACFQAMREWPKINPNEVNCPALLLAGNKNSSVIDWLKPNQTSLDRANVQVEIIDGLNHQQEFSNIDRVYPIVKPFLSRWSLATKPSRPEMCS